MVALFPLGRVVATPGALNVFLTAGQEPDELLGRHQSGDWGEVSPEDARENEVSIREGLRVLSSYPVGSSATRIWIVTEALRRKWRERVDRTDGIAAAMPHGLSGVDETKPLAFRNS